MTDQGPPSPDTATRDLVTLVAALNRFLIRLTSMEAFREGKLTLAAWLVLSRIADKDGINNRQLSIQLAVSPQRINQITDSLKEDGLISVTLSPSDARIRTISITPLGSARLQDLNVKLQSKMALLLAERPGILQRSAALINGNLMQIVMPPKTKEAGVSGKLQNLASAARRLSGLLRPGSDPANRNER
jgi:DNA-binding MarR family transcriptional regulator